MSTRPNSDRVAMHLHAGDAGAPLRPAADSPFRVCVLGDFSGRASRGLVGTSDDLRLRTPVHVDRDDLDAVIDGFRPEVRLDLSAAAGTEMIVAVREMEDFHPDRLIGRLPTFKALRKSRDSLVSPVSPGDEEAAPAKSPPAVGGSGNLLDEILGIASTDSTATPSAPRDELEDFVRQVVSPHVTHDSDARSDLVASLDQGIHDHMRQVLHDPAFQRLESTWRGVQLLTRRLETTSRLQIWLVDLSKEEMLADLEAAEDVGESGLSTILDQRAAGPSGNPWSLLVGDYAFGAEEGDMALLERLGDLASRLGAPFIAQGRTTLAGCPSIQQVNDRSAWGPVPDEWARLRRSDHAKWLGMLAPRFLGRLPYGDEGEACFEVEFEEVVGAFGHETLVWLNPAYAGALLLADSFSKSGWALRPGEESEVTDLPLHTYEEDGTMTMTPCAETLMTDRAATGLMEAGLMPLASLKDRDAVRVVRFQSIAEPLAALAGPWTDAPP